MREIKFRAWDKDGKIMVFSMDGFVEDFDVFSIGDWCNKAGYELMQYTGLKDVNGKEIYEGDVVEWDDNSKGRWRRRCVVGWEQSHYTLNGYFYDANIKGSKRHAIEFSFGSFMYESDGELEVIGNIHEHSQLMETK